MNIAWSYLDKKSAAVDALKDFAAMDFILARHPEDAEAALEDMTALASSAPTGLPGAHNPHASEARLTAQLDAFDVLEERYRNAQAFMDWFAPAWQTLTPEERFALDAFYLRPDDKRGVGIGLICEAFTIERSSAYNRKNRALAKLAVLLYGK